MSPNMKYASPIANALSSTPSRSRLLRDSRNQCSASGSVIVEFRERAKSSRNVAAQGVARVPPIDDVERLQKGFASRSVVNGLRVIRGLRKREQDLRPVE